MLRSGLSVPQWWPLVVFVLVCVVCWLVGNGIPYGYDSIESYFTFLVGYNAATFPTVNPLMADIAASPEVGAHPYYYTHNPNLAAHLLSQVLIRLGASDLRFQTALAIVISTAGMILAFKALKRMAGLVLATVTLLIFAFHYVGVVTWSDNLLRAMHFPLFWGNIVLLQRFTERRSRIRLAVVALGTGAVFLNDLTLGLFVLCVQLALVWQTASTFRERLYVSAGATVGSGAALAMWAAVLVLTLGLPVVAQDVAYTFLGRNAAEAITSPQAVADFYSSHSLVFWGHFVDTGDRLGLIASAYREQFRLGHGPLTLLIYPLMLYILAISVWRWLLAMLRRTELGDGDRGPVVGPFVAVGVALGVAVWPGGPASTVVDDWEPFFRLPVMRISLWIVLIAVVALLIAMRARPSRVDASLARLELLLSDRHGVITLHKYVLAVGFTSLLLTWAWIGGFTANFVWTYKPSLVFVEDVVFGAVLVTLVKTVSKTTTRSVQGRLTAGLLAVLAVCWLAYQAHLVERYPPMELAVAAVLQDSVALSGASFVSPDTYHIVWYYTRGRGQSVEVPIGARQLDLDPLMFFRDASTDAQRYRQPEYFICVRQPVQPKESLPCSIWQNALASLRYPIKPGPDLISDPDYLIYRFPR